MSFLLYLHSGTRAETRKWPFIRSSTNMRTLVSCMRPPFEIFPGTVPCLYVYRSFITAFRQSNLSPGAFPGFTGQGRGYWRENKNAAPSGGERINLNCWGCSILYSFVIFAFPMALTGPMDCLVGARPATVHTSYHGTFTGQSEL